MKTLTKEEAKEIKRHTVFYYQNVVNVYEQGVLVKFYLGSHRIGRALIPWDQIKFIESYSRVKKEKIGRYYAPNKIIAEHIPYRRY